MTTIDVRAPYRAPAQVSPNGEHRATRPIRLALVDDHKMLLGALSEWIRGAAYDIQLVAAVTSFPELLAHSAFPLVAPGVYRAP